MLISELKNDTETALAWGVEIDAEVYNPPANIRLVGLLWEGDDPKSLSERLLDTAIAFSLSGAEVIIEVRPSDDVDPVYLLEVAGNSDFSVSLVPPTSPEEINAWCQQCARFAEALLTTPNFSTSLFPVTGYITYLILELFAGADQLTPSDTYTRQRFVEAVPTEWSDAAKLAMRSAMSDLLGGPEGLRDYLGALLRALKGEASQVVFENMKARAAR